MNRVVWLLLLACCGCASRAESPRAACVTDALAQPGLRNGVAAFTGQDGGVELAAAGMQGWLRLQTGREYAAASLTKPRVAFAIRRLVDAGRIDLDARASTILRQHGFTGSGASGITVRQLLQHTAGLEHPPRRDPLWFRDGPGAPDADCAAAGHYVLQLPVASMPCQRTRYSNAGYCLLGSIVLASADGVDMDPLHPVLRSSLGGAGGWRGSLPELYAGLRQTLPTSTLPSPAEGLPDGSWYSWGWRYWPWPQAGAPFTHTGRLPGMLAVALTDGNDALLVAHFDGDPADYQRAAARFGREAWACMRS